MPTVHLSIPDKMYKELKDKAASMGIQVTDLIKIYAIQGLKYGFDSGVDMNFVSGLKEDIEKINGELKERITKLEGRYYELVELVNYLFKRVDTLQEIVESRVALVPRDKIENIDLS
ncbi:MAG: hypothetical protein LRS47_01980 [Desulfurococcales archaeon]|nr:hypothetical protein [Desulfurococcales archaeon]